MTFDSTIFLFAFLPVSFILYYVTPAKFKNLTLVLVSILFYAWGGVVHALFLLVSVVWNYAGGELIGKNLGRRKRAKNIMMIAVGADIALLFIGRYIGQFLEMTGNDIADSRYFLVPVGISFFMLQNIAYIIDIYREEISPQKDIVKFTAQIVMYPKIIAGPLVSAAEFEKQLENRKLSLGKISDGILLFLRGLSEKVIFGNGMEMVFETIQALPAGQMSVVSAWLGCVAFALRIYFTFGGYCDMAAGLSRMLGFEFELSVPVNGNHGFLEQMDGYFVEMVLFLRLSPAVRRESGRYDGFLRLADYMAFDWSVARDKRNICNMGNLFCGAAICGRICAG